MGLEPEVKKSVRTAGKYSAVGIEMGLGVGLGVYVGWLVDGNFNTAPWGVACGAFFGIGAAAMVFYRIYRDVTRESEEPKNR